LAAKGLKKLKGEEEKIKPMGIRLEVLK